MRIGIFTNTYLPYVSGVTTSVYNLYNQLAKMGHQPYIFTGGSKLSKSKQRIFNYPAFTIPYYKLPCPIPISAKLSSLIPKLNLDIIHTNHFVNLCKKAPHYAKKYGIPLVFTFHTRFDLYADYHLKQFRKVTKKFFLGTLRNYVTQCDCIIVTTKEVKKILCEYGINNRIEVVQYGLDLSLFKGKLRQDIKKRYGIDNQKKLLLHIGRLSKEKNIDFILKSFKKVNRQYKKSHLMIVGSGSYEPKLKKLSKKIGIKDFVTFTGQVNNSYIPDYLKASDIFLFSSFTETFGVVIIESLASGTPVVALNAPGVRDIIKNNKNGYLTDDSITEFSEKVLKLLVNKDLMLKFSKNAIESADDYSITKTAKKIVDVYKSLI